MGRPCGCRDVECVTCFIAGSVITLSDGTTTTIENGKVGLQTKSSLTNTINNVVGLEVTTIGSRKLYGINDGQPFFTQDHAILTTEGWAVIDIALFMKHYPSTALLIGTPKQLTIGKTVLTTDGPVVIKQLPNITISPDTKLYDWVLDGDHSYYVNGLAVHNCSPPPPPPEPGCPDCPGIHSQYQLPTGYPEVTGSKEKILVIQVCSSSSSQSYYGYVYLNGTVIDSLLVSLTDGQAGGIYISDENTTISESDTLLACDGTDLNQLAFAPSLLLAYPDENVITVGFSPNSGGDNGDYVTGEVIVISYDYPYVEDRTGEAADASCEVARKQFSTPFYSTNWDLRFRLCQPDSEII
jgi:hypothetical protein